MSKQPDIRLDIPYFMKEPQQHMRAIKWCDKHWADLMHGLIGRGMGEMIAPDADTLNSKFVRGEQDPCWEACSMVNVGAIEIFGAERICDEFNGCPVCTFANIIEHVADAVAQKFVIPQ